MTELIARWRIRRPQRMRCAERGARNGQGTGIVSADRRSLFPVPRSALRTSDRFVRQFVAPVILPIAGVTLGPAPLHVVVSDQIEQFAPKLGVLHRLPVLGAP